MKQKAKQFLVVVMTVFFCAAAFAVTAFAEQTTGGTDQTDNSPTVTKSSFSITAYDSDNKTIWKTYKVTSEVVKTESSGETITTTSYTLESGGDELSNQSSPITLGDLLDQGLGHPDGYTKWTNKTGTSYGTTFAFSESTALYPGGKTEPAASSKTSSAAKSSSSSRATPSYSDNTSYDGITSFAWDAYELDSNTDSVVSAFSGDLASSDGNSPTSGGVSWMLILGVILIAVGLGGIGYYVYLQFFSKPHGPNDGPKGGSGSAAGGNEDETAEVPQVFTDVSSYSDGQKHEDAALQEETRQMPADLHVGRYAVRRTAPADVEKTVVFPKARSSAPASEQKAAQPEAERKDDFDWKAFFEKQV